MISYIEKDGQVMIEFTHEPRRELYFSATGYSKSGARENLMAKINTRLQAAQDEVKQIKAALREFKGETPRGDIGSVKFDEIKPGTELFEVFCVNGAQRPRFYNRMLVTNYPSHDNSIGSWFVQVKYAGQNVDREISLRDRRVECPHIEGRSVEDGPMYNMHRLFTSREAANAYIAMYDEGTLPDDYKDFMEDANPTYW